MATLRTVSPSNAGQRRTNSAAAEFRFPWSSPDDVSVGDGESQQTAIQSGTHTRAELVRSQLERVHHKNGQFRAFSFVVNIDNAVECAAELDRKHNRTLDSDIDGLTFSVKGCIPVEGQPWTEGSHLYADRKADRSADAVRSLKAAGAVFAGLTTLTELALYAPDNPFEPVALNPWAFERTPGGSSSGAGVAAATAMAVINLGTDSGGSIRNPACHCGVFGFKPSLNRWPMDTVPNYTPSLTTLGCIARSVRDIEAVDKVLAGDFVPKPNPKTRLLIPERLIAQYADEPTQELFAAAVAHLRDAGFPVEEFDEPLWESAERAAGTVSMAEAANHLRDADVTLLAPALAERLRLGRTMSDELVAIARDTMNRFRLALSPNVTQGCFIVTPTWPFRAPHIRQTAAVIQGRRVRVDPHRNVFVRAANAASAPALTIPAGMYPGRIPFGIQLMAPQGRDRYLLSVADLVAKAVMKSSPNTCST